MEQVHLFTKKLKPAHISHTLSVPTHVLEAFPFPEGAHMMNFEAVDATDNSRKGLAPKTGLTSSRREMKQMTWSGGTRLELNESDDLDGARCLGRRRGSSPIWSLKSLTCKLLARKEPFPLHS
ncbi:hypothetical protein H0E87_007529 [Populus deltoides]|uniref:Uncharacterized protein n=1 Tax=Populus deltoides TaxID=3696 RepID=A0A8T2ZBJ9_POPDE|nr:hypothetical protein H0E87_007529 [Populus deltoides]